MYKSYLSTAWRQLRSASFHSVISIFCLTVGITGAIMISIHLNHELSHDAHHRNHERIFRMEGLYNMAGTSYEMAITPFPLALAMLEEFSEIESYARFFVQEETMVNAGGRDFLETGFVYADSTVFDIFTHRFIHGTPRGSLSEPGTVVLNQTLSSKYFGQGNPMGRSIEINQEHFLVTGVVEDLPRNTHFPYEAMMSMPSADPRVVYSLDPELFWNINHNYTYIMLHTEREIASVLEKMDDFSKKYVGPMVETFGAQATYAATPLRETHFTPLMMAPETGNKSTLTIFGLVGLFLIVIAAINYTNISTARAAKRAREIGVRKVVGAGKTQLMIQFLTEALTVSFISMVLSLFLIELLWPVFNSFAGSDYSMSDLFKGQMVVYILCITLFTGLAAGFYPAFVLSRMNPSLVIKGGTQKSPGSALLRKALVVFQFSVSIVLVTSTLTVANQMRFLQNKPLGFEPKQRLVVTLQGTARQSIEALEQKILQNPLVFNTSKTFSVPGKDHNVIALRLENESGMQEAAIAVNYIDFGFLDLMEIPVIHGRGFDRDLRSDILQAALVTQATVEQYGWQENPIGKEIHMQFDQEGVAQRKLRVVGVVDDYHFLNLKNPIEPQMMLLPETPSTYRHIIVEYQPGQDEAVMTFLENTTQAFDTSRLPEIHPLNAGFAVQFESEERQGKTFGLFALVTILISFLGLFGLSSFMAEQRKKEIGIRKVLGASSKGVLMMLYREFLLLIFLAVVIASPLSWYFMQRWLDGFLYSIPMSLAPIVFATVIAFATAMATVTWHSLKAASINPIDSIRTE